MINKKIAQSYDFVTRGVEKLITKINNDAYGAMNEATLQHHLAMNIHLDSLQQHRCNLSMILEKKVLRENDVYPKTRKNSANIDVLFTDRDNGVRCAIELKCFHRVNHREPNNRYDAYADIANLEAYLGDHADVGVFVLFTDHPHYFDNNFRAHSHKTNDFCLRQNHQYKAGRILSYQTETPYGPDIVLRLNYKFSWQNLEGRWKVLVLKVSEEE